MSKEIQPQYQKGWVVVVDWGSTSIKIAGLGLMNNQQLTEYYEDPWIDWTKKTEVLQVDGIPPFKCIRNHNLDEVLQTVKQNVRSMVGFMQDTVPAPVIIGETGFTNSLVIEWDDNQAIRHKVLLLDNPSLHSDQLPSKQLEILHEYGLNGDEEALRIKTIMKMLTLKNNPHLIASLCGEGVTFEDLSFTTMLGLLSDEFGNNAIRTGIPPDDLRAMVTTAAIPRTEDVIKMVNELGVESDQFVVSTGDAVPSYIKPVADRENDWKMESKLIKFLRERQLIDRHAVMVVLDTIGKFSSLELNFPKTSSGSGEKYITQRITGGVIPQWFHHHFSNEDGTIDYEGIHRSLKQLIDQNLDLDQWYFDPDNMTDGNDRGVLFHNTDAGWVSIAPETLEDFDTNQQNQAFLALALGVFFAIRKKIEHVLPKEQSFPALEVYGGLGSHGQDSWMNLLHQVFADTTIHRIENMGGFTAAGYATAESFGWYVPSISIDRTKLPPPRRNRMTEYEQWKARTNR